MMSLPGWEFRQIWIKARHDLGVPAVYTPYSIRRGAATALFMETSSLPVVASQGRWKSEKVCRQYINTALTALNEDVWSAPLKRLHVFFCQRAVTS